MRQQRTLLISSILNKMADILLCVMFSSLFMPFMSEYILFSLSFIRAISNIMGLLDLSPVHVDECTLLTDRVSICDVVCNSRFKFSNLNHLDK